MQFDELFNYFGEFGSYQMLIFLMCISPTLVSDTIALNFLTGRMDHWCRVPELEGLSQDQQRHILAPYTDGAGEEYDGCNMFDINYGAYNLSEYESWARLPNTTTTIQCPQGWMYDRSVFTETTVSAFDLVCDKANLVPLPGTIFFAGSMIGTFTAGVLSDRFGRRKIFCIYMVIKLLGGLLSGWSPTFWVFGLGKFIQGFVGNGYYVCGYLMCMEVIGPRYRGVFGILYPFAVTVSYFVSSGMAYLMRNYRVLQLVQISPLVIFVPLTYFLPEPPRWLIQNNRLQEAGDVLRTLAKVNKRPVPDNLDPMLEQIREEEVKLRESSVKKKNVVDLYKSRTMLPRALAINFHWFVDSMTYYALSLNAGSLAGSIYLNTFFLGLVEVPATLTCMTLVNFRYMGRRKTTSLGLLLAGLSGLILVPLILSDASSTSLPILSFAGKAFATIGFNGIYMFSVESFPTEVRHVGMGAGSLCGRIGGVIAPYMGPSMAEIWSPLPSLIFGVCGLLAGSFILVVPETLGLPMLQTMEEAEQRTVRGYRYPKKSTAKKSIDLEGSDNKGCTKDNSQNESVTDTEGTTETVEENKL